MGARDEMEAQRVPHAQPDRNIFTKGPKNENV
jgi:hypothetical protein